NFPNRADRATSQSTDHYRADATQYSVHPKRTAPPPIPNQSASPNEFAATRLPKASRSPDLNSDIPDRHDSKSANADALRAKLLPSLAHKPHQAPTAQTSPLPLE